VASRQCSAVSQGKARRCDSNRDLAEHITNMLHREEAVLDGEIVCVDKRGRPQFRDLLFRRGEPCYFAFDLLSVQHGGFHSHPAGSTPLSGCTIFPQPLRQSVCNPRRELRRRTNRGCSRQGPSQSDNWSECIRQCSSPTVGQ